MNFEPTFNIIITTPAKNLLLFKYKIWSCKNKRGFLKKLILLPGGAGGAGPNIPGITLDPEPDPDPELLCGIDFFLEDFGGIVILHQEKQIDRLYYAPSSKKNICFV